MQIVIKVVLLELDYLKNVIREPISQMRKVIAHRLAESKFSAPHFYLSISVDMDNAISSRKAINAMPDQRL